MDYYRRMKQEKNQHRLFFALWPSEGVRAAIKKNIQPYIQDHPAKKVPVHNWHITLAFLGNVSSETKACVQQQVALLKEKHFTLQLDHLGYFERARVAWLGCNDVPREMQALFDELNVALAPCGYQSDFKIFTPHLTLLRKVSTALDAQDVAPLNWSVNEFVLVESVTTDHGATYKVINRWKLF